MRPRKYRLSHDDKDLIIAAKEERARLRLQQQIIRRELEQLSDKSLAQKFEVSVHVVQEIGA